MLANVFIMIQNENDLTELEIKKIESIGKRLEKIAKEIKTLGLNVAIHDGTLSILKGESHNGNKANYQNIKYDVSVGQWTSVDW